MESRPEPGPGQHIVKILSSRGNGIHEVEFPDGSKTLACMPLKFKGVVFIRRGRWRWRYVLEASLLDGPSTDLAALSTGQYVIIDPKGIASRENKLGGNIEHVLYAMHVKYLKGINKW